MARTAQDVTEAELALLRHLWDAGPATIRQLTDELYPGGSAAQYATVQKLLERLEEKGFITRDRRASVHVFSASIERDELIGRRLKAIADTLCEGSITPLLSHLMRPDALSAEERRSLRAMIEKMEANFPRRNRRS